MSDYVPVFDRSDQLIGFTSSRSAAKAAKRWPHDFVLQTTESQLKVDVSQSEVPNKAENPIVNLDTYLAKARHWKPAPKRKVPQKHLKVKDFPRPTWETWDTMHETGQEQVPTPTTAQ